jgi:hypothetical protein
VVKRRNDHMTFTTKYLNTRAFVMLSFDQIVGQILSNQMCHLLFTCLYPHDLDLTAMDRPFFHV